MAFILPLSSIYNSLQAQDKFYPTLSLSFMVHLGESIAPEYRSPEILSIFSLLSVAFKVNLDSSVENTLDQSLFIKSKSSYAMLTVHYTVHL